MAALALVAFCLALMADPARAEVECEKAPVCDEEECLLEDGCACSHTTPGLAWEETPQIVYLTFDDAFTELAENLFYSGLFNGQFKNPNGCPIRATHFLSHMYTDYELVHEYWTMGHEFATHSITHRNDETYWKKMDAEGWTNEIGGMKDMISAYANIPRGDIVGMRAPFLQPGGEEQFSVMRQLRLLYDSSLSSLSFGHENINNGLWPFTYDYKSEMDCGIGPCPECAWPGVWEQPILDLEDNRFGSSPTANKSLGASCNMLDSCVIPDEQPQTADTVFDMLQRNFDRVHKDNTSTKAPFGLYMHAAWFSGNEWRYDGYKRFVEYMMSFDDVYIVPIKDGLAWRQNPVPLSELADSELFGCEDYPYDNECTNPKRCRYTDVQNEDLNLDEIYMNVCTSCPDNYPWLGNVDGY